MSYVRKKKVGKYEYYQLVEGYREGGKVRQRVLAHLGRHATVAEAIAYWQARAGYHRKCARDLASAAPLMRERKVWRVRYGRGPWFVPRDGTPVEPTPPSGGFAPPGWFYFRGTPDDAEQEARELLLKAAEVEAKIERLQAL